MEKSTQFTIIDNFETIFCAKSTVYLVELSVCFQHRSRSYPAAIFGSRKNFLNPLTNPFDCDIILPLDIWVWRRLVARYLGVVEAAGSNPVTQTNKNRITKPFVSISRTVLFYLQIIFVRYLCAITEKRY